MDHATEACLRPDLKFVGILLLVVSPVAAIVGVNSVQRRNVQRATLCLTTAFPLGMSFSEAEKSVMTLYPGHTTSFTSADCEKWSHKTTPAYISQGGPCIFGLVEVGGLRIIDASLTFKLIFGPDERLSQLSSDLEYTFL